MTKRTPGRLARFLRDFFGVPEAPVDYGRYQCECHQKMGNEFWHLPLDACDRLGGCDYRSKPFKKSAL